MQIWNGSDKYCWRYRADTILSTDGQTDRQTDRWTDRGMEDVKPVYPPFNFFEVGGIIKITLSSESGIHKYIPTMVRHNKIHTSNNECKCLLCSYTRNPIQPSLKISSKCACMHHVAKIDYVRTYKEVDVVFKPKIDSNYGCLLQQAWAAWWMSSLNMINGVWLIFCHPSFAIHCHGSNNGRSKI